MSSKFKIIETSVVLKEADKRLFILCTQKGFADFRNYIGRLMPACIEDIIFTDDSDYIISLREENFSSLLHEVLIDAERDTIKDIPRIFQDIFEKEEYKHLAKRKKYFGSANEINLIGKCNNEDYEILIDENEKFNMSEEALLWHNKLRIKIITNRLTAEYLSGHFEGFKFSWKMRENEFIKPQDIGIFGDIETKMLAWKNSCKQAWKTFQTVGGGERMSRLILPNTIVYEIHLNSELIGLIRFCNTIVKNDRHYLSNDELFFIFKELRHIISTFDYLTVVKDLITEMDTVIHEYNLPF